MPSAMFVKCYYPDRELDWNNISKCTWVPVLKCYWRVKREDLHLLGNPIFFPGDQDIEY